MEINSYETFVEAVTEALHHPCTKHGEDCDCRDELCNLIMLYYYNMLPDRIIN